MASFSEIYIKKEVLETILKTLEAKNEKGILLTVGLWDKPNDYGQNVTVAVSQTKEERESKKKVFYVGNGNTYYSKGETPVCLKKRKGEVNNDIPDNSDGVVGDDSLPY